jgi:hypothetical protein
MKILRAIATAALTVTFSVPVLLQPTHAEAPSAATADRGMSGSSYRALAVNTTTDGLNSWRPATAGNGHEAATLRPVSPKVSPDDLNWLEGGGG